MKRNYPWLVGVGFLGALLFPGCSSSRPSDPVPVKTVAVTSGQIEKELILSGVLAPNKSLNIYPKLSGQAKSVRVDIGDTVRQGQLLVEIDTKELNAQLGVAEAAAATVRDQAAQARLGIESAKLNLDLAQKNYDRTKSLFESKAVPQSTMDDAQTKLDLAKIAFNNAQQQYQTVGGSGLAQAEAQINLIRVQISNSLITSPIDGTVTNRNINVGELTAPSLSLMTIADTATLKLQGTVSQEDVPLIHLGDRVNVSVDGLGGISFEGTVTQVGPIAATTGQYFPVVIAVVNNGKLLAGMTAKAVFKLTSPRGLIVPQSALNTDGPQPFVFVVANNRVAKRVVEVVNRGNGNALISSGLNEGDQVATTNVGLLQDGMEVRP